jgi:hypothetical protein
VVLEFSLPALVNHSRHKTNLLQEGFTQLSRTIRDPPALSADRQAGHGLAESKAKLSYVILQATTIFVKSASPGYMYIPSIKSQGSLDYSRTRSMRAPRACNFSSTAS